MISKEKEQMIDKWVDEHSYEYLFDLAKLVSIDSHAVDGDPDSKEPFGLGVSNVFHQAKSLATKYGFEVDKSNRHYLLASVGEGKEKIGLFGHLDVVPAGDNWNYPPFEMTVDGDWIIGRGVSDDKGPLWASVYAVRCLKELNMLPKRKVEIFMGGDEECGMGDLEAYIEDHKDDLPVVSFTPDAEYPLCHGEKGIMRFNMIVPNEDSNVKSFIGGTVRNVVAAHAEMVLDVPFEKAKEKLEGVDRITIQPEGNKTRITCEGAAVHASTPDKGINAIGVLANAVLASGLANEGAKKSLEFVSLINSDCHGKALGVPFEDEPSGKLSHVGGVINDEGFTFNYSMDIRYPVTCKGEDVIEGIKKTFAPYGVEIVDFEDSHPVYTPIDSEIVKTCIDTINGVFKKDWEPFTMGGGTYARHLPNAYALGAENPDIPSPYGIYRGGMHQADEVTSIHNLINTIKLYARLLLNVDELDY